MSHLADVLVPPNAEGTRATVLRWCKQVGDAVTKDEPLVELETDKVTVEIPAPADGTLFEVLKQANAEVVPDEVLARLSLGTARRQDDRATSRAETTPPVETAPPVDTAPPIVAETPPPKHAEKIRGAAESRVSRQVLSPSVRRLLKEHSMDAADIEGTGRDGRVTAQDVIRHAVRAAPARVPHSAIRRRIADHMARSMLEAPHVTTLFEADLTRVLTHRSRNAADFESRGARLTLTAYFVSACARALRANPEVNATFHADALELHSDANIGVGTALGSKGLIVPVIHRAQHLSLFGVAQRLRLRGRSRARGQAVARGRTRRHVHDLQPRRGRESLGGAHRHQSTSSRHSRRR